MPNAYHLYTGWRRYNTIGMNQKLVKPLVTKVVELRAKVSTMGDKFVIIIPKSYHKDFERAKMVGEFVDVRVSLPDGDDK